MTEIQDAIIVGSGPAGAGAALGLAEKGVKPLILDVGNQPLPHQPIEENFYDFRKKNDVFELMIGSDYAGLQNIFHKTNKTPKLTAPLLRYVTEGAEDLSPLKEEGFTTVQSFGRGGLASAWGAGLFRFTDRELQGLPISAAELDPFYDKLTKEIGISGADDDLTPYFGSTKHLLKPLPLTAKAAKLFRRYQKKKKNLLKQGIYMGRPRLGVLSEDHGGRAAPGSRGSDEYWLPELSYIYNPAFTIKKLIDQDKIMYCRGILVTSWQRKNKKIIVSAKDLASGSPVSFSTRKLILAAGTVNTTRIVLQSKKDYSSELTLLDNPLVQMPLFFPGYIGGRLEKETFGMGHINMIFDLEKYGVLLQGGTLELISPARGVFYDQFPFAARDNIRLTRLAASAVMVLLLFFPSSEENAARLRLTPAGELDIRCPPYQIDKHILKHIARGLRKLGVMTLSMFTQFSLPGYGIHYAGTLPMKEKPASPYQCDRHGELFGEPGVFIADGAVLPRIPAKNLSLTIMANAMRTAHFLASGGGAVHPPS